MFRRSRSSSIISVDVDEIERRLRTMERRLERLGGRTSARAAQAADQVGESIASALTSIAERFRGGASVAGDEAVRMGNEAAELGNEALRRIAREVERRPLVILAVAVGVGILVGLAGRRR
jgi:hypothetical protein